jgi:hypothetical protein
MKYTSRKFWFSITVATMVLAAGALCGPIPAMAAQLAVVVGGLVTICGIYVGGNTASKWVVGKMSTNPTSTEEKAEGEAEGKPEK